MNYKLILIISTLFIQSISFSQTETQKEMMYKFMNSRSLPTSASIRPKPKPIASKEVLFRDATVFPVYKIVFDASNKPNLIQNKNYFLILHLGRLCTFIDDDGMSEHLKDDIFYKSISKLNIELI